MSSKKTDPLLNWLIAITVIFGFSLTVIFFVLSSIKELSIQEKIQYRNQALTTTAIVFLASAAMFNTYYAARRAQAMQKNAIATEKNLEIGIQNAKLNQDRLIAERFMGAIAQLGHEKVETRTGAIYALERVAQDFPQEHWTIMEILTAFVRENAPIQQVKGEQQPEYQRAVYSSRRRGGLHPTPQVDQNLHEEFPKIRTDIQAALTVIGRRNLLEDPKDQKLDLRNTDIRQADLLKTNLQQADLRGADLSGADLRGADLSGADLSGVKLIRSILYETKLLKASLCGANLCWANLNRTNLSGANLRSANLSGASLRGANLQAANLYKANLQQATLKLANLSGAKLFLANLQGAKLGKANLHLTGLIGANLCGANLNGANLSGANLNAAKLHQTEVYFANLSEASFTEADLYQANLIGANLNRATFYQANLTQANLMGANFSQANLNDVKLEGTILTGAKNLELHQIREALGDRTTRLPDYIEAPTHWRQSG
ncbi:MULTISPECIES: pentapeptide repeat-containing protein [unclassified Nostoc]|uniref:pentapeptide repeat-containing protein n=1 Tax=unclassified Nostoc TaxID=2593658 RepID=UPI002AD459CE|nr:pentapeptide repeat-containing protein [Nostoc sp. DedQUE03]MDZ7975874.1 pentapeptide repeat-containing protein [Nostoc sp. DedQUE03]MDZ8047876.1 pentapeptide repeat-containing protein [Nostoc sp. DedQUE02]